MICTASLMKLVKSNSIMLDSDKIFSLIKECKNILILSHRGPDADTLGSAGALAFYINSLPDKKVTIGNIDPVPTNLDFFDINQFYTNSEELNFFNYDLIITVDCGDTTQTGVAEKFLQVRGKITTINIDHHQTNPYYADINVVQPAGATTELIYRFLKKHHIPITKEIGTLLLTGIITDTTYFTNAGTTKESMSIASELLRNKANIKKIIQNTWRNNSPEALKLWGKILSQLHFNEKHKIVTAVITKQDAILPEVFEGMANFLTTLYEANIILVMRESDDNIIKCSLRTTKDHIDVSRLAQKFGGGGHAKAAGFSITGKLEKIEAGWSVVKI